MALMLITGMAFADSVYVLDEIAVTGSRLDKKV